MLSILLLLASLHVSFSVSSSVCSCRYLLHSSPDDEAYFYSCMAAGENACPPLPDAPRRQALFEILKLADDIVWPASGVSRAPYDDLAALLTAQLRESSAVSDRDGATASK